MKNNKRNKFFICATEQSGDNIGYKLIKEIQFRNKIVFEGVGGNKMSKLMINQYFSLEDFKSVGIFEIIFSIKKYINIIHFLSKKIIQEKYDIVITIDSPDFNFRLAKKIKDNGFKGKIIHIVAPTVWAWRRNRAKQFALYFDKLLVVLPFENKYFEKYNLSTTFIGHPIFYIKNKKKISNKKFIIFLPGSRENEVKKLIKYFKTINDYIYNASLNYNIFIPTLPHLKNKIILLTGNWKIKPIVETDSNIIESAYSETYLAIVCSGTVSLEVIKRGIPQIVIYKLNFFTVLLLKFLVKVKYANIVNIMLNKMIIPEITNLSLTNKRLLDTFKQFLNNYNDNTQVKDSKKIIEKLILEKSPAKIAAEEIEKLFLPKPFKD